MTQSAASVNDAEAFLSGFSGNIFIRLLHGDYNPETQEPSRLKPRQFYGDLAAVLGWLKSVAVQLNSGANDDLKFSVFYCVGDPGQGRHAKQGDVTFLRSIYQDCDQPEFIDVDVQIAGHSAHAVVETSPGKRQRIWHIEPLDAFRARAIHDHMASRHHHDPSTHGAHRLLRLPGFRNWKYDGGPVSRLLAISDRPKLAVDAVFAHFGMQAHDRPKTHMERTVSRAQSSGDLPDGNVYDINKARAAKAGSIDRDTTDIQRERDALDTKTNQLPTRRVLEVLSLIEPDTHRNEWRRVLAALHYMAGEREWGKELAELWSSQAAHRFDLGQFERHWAGLDRDVSNPATWATLQRMTAQLRHDDATRSLLNCVAFKRFEEEHGPALEYESYLVEYPVIVREGAGDTSTFRPDPRARKNVEKLLEMEGLVVYYDAFFQTYMALSDGVSVEIDQLILTRLHSTAHATGFRAEKRFLSEQIDAIASDLTRDPVRKYLRSLPVWDGKERLATAFQRLMGAPDTPSVRELLTLIMCAIVRRTYNPGAKFDLMPILEGRQGLGKSSFFRLLMPNADWFGEGPKMNEEAKRLLSQLGGKLVIEFAELAGNSKQNIDSIKKLITQQTDEFIANYATKKTKAPRRCVFVGTVNGTQYLRDLTDNRRFPIIPVTKELDYQALKGERDQLWAEALLTESVMGELRLTDEAEDEMKLTQQDRLDVNSETTAIMQELSAFKYGWLTIEDVWERIGIPFHNRERRTGQAQYLFGEIKQLMERDGWTWQGVLWHEGKSKRAIVRKERRGTPPQIVCNGGVFVEATSTEDIEDLLA